MTVYPDTLRLLSKACQGYRNKTTSYDEMWGALSDAADDIVAAEERELRDFLMTAEACFDSIYYSVAEENRYAKGLEVVSETEMMIKKWDNITY